MPPRRTARPAPAGETVEATFVRRRVERDGGAWAISDVDDPKGTIVGPMPDPRPGCRVRLIGAARDVHPTYGPQTKYRDYEWLGFSDMRGVARHLADVCEGIGDALAGRVVETLGQDAIARLRDDPDGAAALVRGLRPDVARAAAGALRAHAETERLSVLLRGAGVGAKRVGALLSEYGTARLGEVLKSNPWRLAEDVDGIGFATADALAMKLAHPPDSPLRARSAIVHFAAEATRNGDVRVAASVVASEAAKCGVPASAFADAMREIPAVGPDGADLPTNVDGDPDGTDGRVGTPGSGRCVPGREENMLDVPHARPRVRRVILPDGRVELTPTVLLESEIAIRDRVARMLAAPAPSRAWKDAGGTDVADGRNAADGPSGATDSGVRLDEWQRAALETVRRSNVAVVTGGPGTGKSTIVRALWEALSGPSRVIVLAPTGKAAVRVRQAAQAQGTMLNSYTIHMALARAAAREARDDDFDGMLEADVVVIDECSMVDSALLARLLARVPDAAALYLFGDADQLPPVSPGQPFRDMISSGRVPVARLKLIHRVRPTSWLATNAAEVNAGRMPNLDGNMTDGAPDDFFLIPRNDGPNPPDDSAPAETIVDVVARRLPARQTVEVRDPKTGEVRTRPVDPRVDVQVISPMKERGACGTIELNRRLRDAINPATGPTGPGGFRRGDKVAQKRNDYDLAVMNGEVGIVVAVGRRGDPLPASVRSHARESAADGPVGIDARGDPPVATCDWLVVDIDGTEVPYRAGQAGDLHLAFALTCHSMQGSQAPWIVVPVVKAHSWFFSRQLLYTAITRAQRAVVLVGTEDDLRRAVKNAKDSRRATFLAGWLAEPADAATHG